MYQDFIDLCQRHQEQILIGLASFLGWIGLIWSKNKVVKWYRGPELTVSEEVAEIIKILQEKRNEIIICEQIKMAPHVLNWPNVLFIDVEGNDRKVETFNPSSKILLNWKEKGILKLFLAELYEERTNLNKKTALQNMKYVKVPTNEPEPYYNPEFQLGDVVVLKSGGPTMTIYKIETKTLSDRQPYLCGYFDKDGKYQKEEKFFEEELKKYEPETKNILPTGGIVPGNNDASTPVTTGKKTSQPKFVIRRSYVWENADRGGKYYVGISPEGLYITGTGSLTKDFYDFSSTHTIKKIIEYKFQSTNIEDFTEKPGGTNQSCATQTLQPQT